MVEKCRLGRTRGKKVSYGECSFTQKRR